MRTRPNLYDTDLAAWADAQARALREGRLDALDVKHLIEELDDLSKRTRSAIESSLFRVLVHLLKWQHRPDLRSPSWIRTIIEHRARIARLIARNPSLNCELDGLHANAYQRARQRAVREIGLPLEIFPPESPWRLEDVLKREPHEDALARGFPTD